MYILVAVQCPTADFLFDSDARVVADTLAHASERIKKRGLASVGITN